MRRPVTLIAVLLASAAAGCGDEPRGREGSITIGVSSQPDSLDPALSYSGEPS